VKKVIKLFIYFIIILIMGSILPWFIFPVLNDIKAAKLKNTLQSNPLPQNTKIIDVVSGCGNTGGTGDHTEIWAAILIKTELSEEEIYEFYGKKVFKVSDEDKETFIMRLLDKEFACLKEISNYDGYYIIECIGDPVSSFFDFRGN
jgi:hypothetical protein